MSRQLRFCLVIFFAGCLPVTIVPTHANADEAVISIIKSIVVPMIKDGITQSNNNNGNGATQANTQTQYRGDECRRTPRNCSKPPEGYLVLNAAGKCKCRE